MLSSTIEHTLAKREAAKHIHHRKQCEEHLYQGIGNLLYQNRPIYHKSTSK